MMIDIPVTALIPQREPFILIDHLLSVTDSEVATNFFIDPSHILVENGSLSAYGLIENMAQTAACLSGYEAYIKNTIPKTGFIGTITQSPIYKLPQQGVMIQTRAKRTTQIMNVIVIEAESFLGDEKLAQCTMKIVLID